MKKMRVLSKYNMIPVMMTASCLILICMLEANGSDNPKDGETAGNLTCMYTMHSPRIDARLNEKEWASARSVKIDGTLSKRPVKSKNNMEVRTLWDEKNLYMAFVVRDKNLQAKQTVTDHPQLSLDDIIEFLIDPNNDKDSCWAADDIVYHINLLNHKKDDSGSASCITDPKWNGSARSSVKFSGTLNDSTDIDKGYIVEVAVPWKELHVSPANNFKMGIDFANGDSGIYFDWMEARPLRSPYAFGNLILVK